MPRFLMCRPSRFGLDTAVNPWSASRHVAKRELANRQWAQLRDWLVSRLHAEVLTVPPACDAPGMVFTANAGLVHDRRVVPSRFRRETRRCEAPAFRAWFEGAGYEILDLLPGSCFEGQGEMLWVGDRYVAGYHFDEDLAVHRWISRQLRVPVLSVKLASPRFYHLDTCFCPLGPGLAAYYPPAFERRARRALAGEVPELLEITSRDAFRLAANSIVIGEEVIIGEGCVDFERQLVAEGFRVCPVRLSEFLLEGGGAKCLVLRLDQLTRTPTAALSVHDRAH